MNSILVPDRQKLIVTFSILGALIGSFALRKIPARVDIFDLREVPGFVAFVFVKLPIDAFNLLTSNAFVPNAEGFIVFPTLPQVAFALLCDVAVVYVMACVVCHCRSGGDPE